MGTKLLLFDLDGTLLRSDKSLSAATLAALDACGFAAASALLRLLRRLNVPSARVTGSR